MYRTTQFSVIAIIALILTTTYSCKKEAEPEAPVSTGVFKDMKLKDSYLIPKRTSEKVLQNNSFTLSDNYLYGINNDGLFQMDFDGHSKVLYPGNWSTMYQVTYAADGFLYLSQSSDSHPWNEMVKLDESGAVIATYPLPEMRHGNFGLDVKTGYVYLTHSRNKYEIHCFNLITGDSITIIGSNGNGDADFPNPVAVVGSDQVGHVYVSMSNEDKGMVFNYDGSFKRSIADTKVEFHSWRGGYYVNDYLFGTTIFNDGSGTNLGSHVHNLDANGYFFEEELSPDGNTAVIRLNEFYYVYQK